MSILRVLLRFGIVSMESIVVPIVATMGMSMVRAVTLILSGAALSRRFRT